MFTGATERKRVLPLTVPCSLRDTVFALEVRPHGSGSLQGSTMAGPTGTGEVSRPGVAMTVMAGYGQWRHSRLHRSTLEAGKCKLIL